MTDKTLYGFNYSQDVIDLQTKYTLFKRVANIIFTFTYDEPFDMDLMHKAINILIERNDCLRTVFVKKDGKVMQYFEDRKELKKIPYKEFDSVSKMDAFVKRYRKKVANCFKGECFDAIFFKNPEGKRAILLKVSHFIADTYAVHFLLSDLDAIYRALKNGTELPALPGKFEDVLKKDLEFRNNPAASARDMEFFKNLYTGEYAPHPTYCGIHGDANDRWLKCKKKGMFSLPYLMIKCDTDGYAFSIPAAVNKNAVAWCTENDVPISTFYFYAYSLMASLVNGKAERMLPLELMNCRATLAERKCGGTKVQGVSTYVLVDYKKTFKENIDILYAMQTELYKHTRTSYLELEAIQHKLWNYSMLSQIINFCYSFIPIKNPAGAKIQVLSNGKGALVDYVGLMMDVDTNEVTVIHDVQTKMVTPQQLAESHNIFLRVIETVANPDNAGKKLEEIL